MGSTSPSSDSQPFCVLVHDVSLHFCAEIDHLLQQVQPLVGRQISAAVVPCWHGREPDQQDCRQFELWSGSFGEVLLHGHTHFRDTRPGLVSWLTGRSDEFSNMSAADSVLRLCQAQERMQSILGSPVRGFVPPAWQFPCSATDVRPAGIEYLMRFGRLESSRGNHEDLATWSWDWGWLPGTSRIGARLGRCLKLWQQAIPVIVLHPADVRRGCVPDAVRLIRRFLQRGWKPVLPADIANGMAAGATS